MSELVELGQSPVGCGQPKPKAREDRHDGEKEERLILDCEGPGTAMRITRDGVEDTLLYEIMYFSPVELGDERYTNKLYFQTEIYHRKWPTLMADRMAHQIEKLKHCEMGIVAFDDEFKQNHREAVLTHCKMALAYLDAREARIAMKLCEQCIPATKSSEPRLQTDPDADFDFMRIIALSVLACAARRIKFFQKAIDALGEAKSLCLAGGDTVQQHPLLIALTLLNLSAVLGDIDHDEHGLRWGLEALGLMYNVFSNVELPEMVQAYYLALACHNAALLDVKLGRWAEAQELVDEGIEFTKVLGENDDHLRSKLISIGAQAKHVPEGFLSEAVNALNGWGEERGVWNLSFWDFSMPEIQEVIRVLESTVTLNKLVMDQKDDDRRYELSIENRNLVQLMMAVVSCHCLETVTISGTDYRPRKVWRRVKRRGFLETSWYASALNFSDVWGGGSQMPETGPYQGLIADINHFSKRLVMALLIVANETDGIDLSDNGINAVSGSMLADALNHPERLSRTRACRSLVLRNNDLDPAAASVLARIWDSVQQHDEGKETPDTDGDGFEDEDEEYDPDADPERENETLGVTSLDVSQNTKIGDEGFNDLLQGMSRYRSFQVLRAESISLSAAGCTRIEILEQTRLDTLCLSKNALGCQGVAAVCQALARCSRLRLLELDGCGIKLEGAKALRELLREHIRIQDISVANNQLGDDGGVEVCMGVAESNSLKSVNLAHNGIFSDSAAETIADMMRTCQTLVKLVLSGNHLDHVGPSHIGSAIEHSRVLTLQLEDMGFTADSMDDFLDQGAAETQDLQELVINGNPIGDDGLAIIAESLSIGLINLRMSNCGLTKASQAMLLSLVSLSPNLQRLDVSYNDLGPEGCSDMVKWMDQNDKESFSLNYLEISGCSLGDEGFKQLVPVLGSLHYLGLRDNGITSAGLKAVMSSNQMVKLQTLDLEGNRIGEPGLHALTERFQKEHKRSLWNPKQLTSMIDLVILRNNDISPALAASTEAFVKIYNPLMTIIWLSWESLTMTEATAVIRDQSGYINVSFKKEFDESLQFTGRIGGGLLLDLRRRFPLYLSDWTDAFISGNLQKTVTTIVYLFAAALAPAVTFGSQFYDGTGGQFGVAEMILSTALSGVICSLFAGQPLAIVGPTGPFLAYTLVCYDLAAAVDLEFLPFYFWVCMWCAVFTILVSIFDLCALMKYVTLFTEDVFVGLVSFVYIVDGLRPIILNFTEDPARLSLDGAVFEALLFAYTVGTALYFSHFRRSPWLTRPIRNFLANFAVTIALVSASLLAAGPKADIRMLPMDADFAPSLKLEGLEKRSWIVNPAGMERPLPAWAIAYAIFPALGFTVLGYLDENLTSLIVNRPSNNLKKPPGYHLDLFVRGLFLMPTCGILGLPMSVASTVPSMTHLISLTTYEEKRVEEGIRKEPVKVVEQRATNFIIHLLLGFSLFMAPVLRLLPKSVLHGVFFYMGISSLTGNALFNRMCLWMIWDTTKYPNYHFLGDHMSVRRVHLYTAIQVVCLATLYALKTTSEVAVVFPLFIATLAVIRQALRSIFSEVELQLLDDEPVREEEEEDPAADKPDLLELGMSREDEEKAQAAQLALEEGANDFLPRSLSCD
eukprot:s176_g25.t1